MKKKRDDEIETLTYETGSPFPEEVIGYNWLNYSYPKMHKHQHWEIMLITHGKLLHSINGKSITMSRGDLVLIRPNDCHALLFPDHYTQGTHLNILLKTEYVKSVLDTYKETLYDELIAQSDSCCVSLSDIETQKVINQILNIHSLNSPVSEKVFQLKTIAGRLLNILIENNLLRQKLPDWLTDFLFVLSNPHLKEADVKALASYTPYSYSRLAPVFKNLTGRTLVEYLTEIKMKRAQDLLKTTDTPITQIALDLNYESLSHFIRTFKRVYGITPSAYRKKNML